MTKKTKGEETDSDLETLRSKQVEGELDPNPTKLHIIKSHRGSETDSESTEPEKQHWTARTVSIWTVGATHRENRREAPKKDSQ